MASLLDNLSVFHDEDQRSVADRGQTVGNDETRSALHQLVKRLLNLQFSTGIDAGGRVCISSYISKYFHQYISR